MRYVYVALVVALTAIVLLFTFQNLQAVTVTFFSSTATLPASVLVLLVYLGGMFTGGSVTWLLRSAIHSATREPQHV